MPRVSAASPEDWKTIRRVWEQGGSLTQCSNAVDGRAARSTVKHAAEREGWTRPDGTRQQLPLETRKRMTEAAREAALLSWSKEKERIISRLIETTDTALTDMRSPMVLKEVKLVSGGQGAAQDVEIVEVHYDRAPVGEQKSLMWIAQTAIEKLQLLTGEATSRAETGPILTDADRKQALAELAGVRDEVAARRGLGSPEKPAASAAV